MIKFVTGNLLDSPAEALVNTVNTVGVMGKGIALQFKETFKENFRIYAKACKEGTMKTGKMLVVKENTIQGVKLIINFPTKTEWFMKSKYEYVEEGLKDLVTVIRENNIKSIAVPPLGCGNGGLNWYKVKAMIEKYLGELKNVEVLVFEPNAAVKELLQKQEIKKEIELTPARAMLLHALFQYEMIGEEASVFAANKLAYFLQRSGEPMRLNFEPYKYGPYAIGVEKVLYALNGKYLKGMEQGKFGAFERLQLNYEKQNEVKDYVDTKLSFDQRKRLSNIFKIIEGFESALSIEILSSVDFLLAKNQKLTNEELLIQVQNWNERKKSLIKEQFINVAVTHLKNYSNRLDFA